MFIGTQKYILVLIALLYVLVVIQVNADTKQLQPCNQQIVVKKMRGNLAFGEMRKPPPGKSPSVWLGIFPQALVVDSHGAIYVADQVKYRILKFNKHGKFLLKFTLQPAVKSKVGVTHLIPAMAVDANNRLYVINEDQDRIEIYKKDGEYIRSIDYSNDKISHVRDDLYETGYRPDRINIDILGNIYLYDSLNSGGGVYSPNGKLLRIGIKVDTQGRGVVNYDETKMVGFNNLYYEFGSKKFFFDSLIIRDSKTNRIKQCAITGLEALYVERGIVSTMDKIGNVYVFDFRTLNIIKITLY